MSTFVIFCLVGVMIGLGLRAWAYIGGARRWGRPERAWSAVAWLGLAAVAWSGPGCGMPVKVVAPEKAATPAKVVAPVKAAEKIFPLTPIYPGSVFTGFGEPGEGTKKISVWGDIEQPGVYYFPAEATLYDLIMRMGRCGGGGDARIIPTSVSVSRLDSDGKRQALKLKIYGVPPEELKKVAIPAETTCYFHARIL